MTAAGPVPTGLQSRERERPVAGGAEGAEAVRPRTGRRPAALCLLPLGLLGVAVWFGRWVRPGGDEWCFLPVVRDEGLSGMVGKFYLGDNGRITNAVLVWAYARFGVAGHQWFGLVSGGVMLGILWAVTVSALRRAGLTAPRGVPLFVASMVTAVFLFATPNTYKTFYWPAASVSHTMAPVLASAAALPLLGPGPAGGGALRWSRYSWPVSASGRSRRRRPSSCSSYCRPFFCSSPGNAVAMHGAGA
ncbi:hypothetical protein [Streptomyces sp. LN499]|uniref:hypothetical protein n=1 Tax=Streptomyces sp. LN499 TaxID=3112977 RepID=UPI003716BBB8